MTLQVSGLVAKTCVSWLILTAVLLLLPAVVHACSLGPDYDGPLTNLELVEQSDIIFIGRLVKSLGNDEFDREILVEPIKLLKGSALPKAAKIDGFLSDRTITDGGKHFKIRASQSDAFDIWRPHSDVWTGGCSRHQFNQGSLVVLFFKNEGGTLEWFDPTFARGAEDVPDDKALWVRAVKLYADVLQLPKPEQRTALIEQIKKLRSQTAGDYANILLADDIERQLAGCGPVSNFGFLNKNCSKPQWIYNIANTQYIRSASLPVEVKGGPKEDVGRLALASLFFFFMAISLTAFLYFRKRRRSRMGPSPDCISH